MSVLHLTDILLTRGIAQAAQAANWEEHSYSGQKGWRYPLYNARGERYTVGGKTAYRWKNANSGAPQYKYAWLPSKPDGIRYYLLRDTLKAIKDASGVVYIASGEPDVLAFRSAGKHNTICWFGEQNIPPTLAEDLGRMGAWLAYYYPDRDAAGMKSAARVRELLVDADVQIDVRALPGDLDTKHDINWYWQELGFEAARFNLALSDLPAVEPDDLYLYSLSDAPDESRPKPLPIFADDELPPRFKDAIIRDVESHPGFERWKSSGWSTNFKCPLHDDKHASAGYNRDSHSFNCFVCGDMSAKDYGARRDIHLRDFYDDPPARPTVVAASANGAKPQDAQPDALPEKLWMDNREVGELLVKELRGEILPEIEPMEFPFQTFHRFNGFAELMWPGKLVYISGVSGGGKTSFGEMLYRKAVMVGDGGVWFGPEWSPVEMGLRELQRAGGISMTLYAKMRVYRLDEHRKVPMEFRRGAMPGQSQRERSIQKALDMANWPGRMAYLQPSKSLNSVTAIMDTVEECVTTYRAQGVKMSMLFFDYLQRAPKTGIRGWDWGEVVVGQIKELCERLHLFGFVFIQPKKTDSRNTRDGDTLNESSGQGVSDQQANLYLAMTPGFNKLTGQKEPYVRVDIVKNSMGVSPEKVYLKTAMDRLTILDEEANVKTIKLNEIAFGEEDSEDAAN